MATKTNKLGLSKAELTDAVRSTLTANNGNFDILDNECHSMQGQIARLKANQIQGTASGTEIVVEDSAEMESNLHISGNSEQDSRSGKNLLKKGSFYASKTNCGISFAVNDDESVTINGANDNSGNSTLMLWSDSNNPLQLPSGTYNVSKTGNDDVEVIYYDGANYNILMNNSRNTITFTSDKSLAQVYIQIKKGATTTFDNFKFYPILTKSTDSIEPYEPYGAMPSPDYPSEIRSVTSRSDNLFNQDNEPSYIGGLTGLTKENVQPLDNGVRIIAPTNVSTSNTASLVYAVKDLTNDVGKTIRMKAKFISTGGLKPRYMIGVCNADGSNRTSIKYTSTSGAEITATVPTLTGEQTYLGVWLYLSASGTGVAGDYTEFTDIMVTVDKEITEYQPYYVPVEAKVEGKNLIGKQALSTPSDDTEFWSQLTYATPLEDGWCRVKLKGEGTNTRYSNQFVRRGNIRNIKPSTKYTFYVEFRNVSNKNPSGYVSLAGNNASEIWKGGFQINTIEVKEGLKICKTLTTKDALDVTLDFRTFTAVSPSEDIDFEYRLMILEGEHTLEEIGEYVQNKTISLPLGDIELRSTPDGTRDTFERVDGAWNYRGDIASEIFDGSDDESWEFASESVVKFRINLSNAKPLGQSQSLPPNVHCQRFSAISWDEALKPENDKVATFSTSSTDQKKLRIKYSEITDLKTFKTWLASNPTEVIYPLATPTYTPITDETLIQALDELEQLILHKGYNRITVTSVNGVKAYLDLNYVKDINIVLDNINAKLGGA